jgi:hypothetical protein
MRYLLIGCLTAILFTASADENVPIQTDVLFTHDEMVHAISSFSGVDYFSTFSCKGEFLWEVPFGPKIVSWKKETDRLFVLSKMRNGSAFFLTCIDPANGAILWEKGIYAPNPIVGKETQSSLE